MLHISRNIPFVFIDTKISVTKLLLNSNAINVRLYEMQVHILRDQNFTGSSVSNTHIWA